MKIIENNFPWLVAIVNNRLVEAKYTREKISCGINQGRIIKLSISKNDFIDGKQNFHDQLCYHYSLGLNFSEISEKFLNDIVSQLEIFIDNQ